MRSGWANRFSTCSLARHRPDPHLHAGLLLKVEACAAHSAGEFDCCQIGAAEIPDKGLSVIYDDELVAAFEPPSRPGRHVAAVGAHEYDKRGRRVAVDLELYESAGPIGGRHDVVRGLDFAVDRQVG